MSQPARRAVLQGLGLAGLAPPLWAEGRRLRPRRYAILDVFTDTPLTGNPVAVFLNPEGLSSEAMMALTREINYSECTFLQPPDLPGCDARVRIFAMNSQGEIPIAGHPTIGSTFALANRGLIPAGKPRAVLQLGVGPTPIDLTWRDGRLAFAWMTQQPPVFGGQIPDHAAVARALNLRPEDMAADLPVQQVSCGAPFLMVPLASRAAVDRAELDRGAMGRLIDAAGLTRRGVHIFSLETVEPDVTAYCRMLGFGVAEDAATGNANGPLGAYLVAEGQVSADRQSDMVIRQGVRMRRPSRVHVSVDGAPGRITQVRIGGTAVESGRGELRAR